MPARKKSITEIEKLISPDSRFSFCTCGRCLRKGKIPQCTICLDYLGGDQRLKTLACGHIFHEKCIMIWLSGNSTCPACRRVVDSKPCPGTSGDHGRADGGVFEAEVEVPNGEAHGTGTDTDYTAPKIGLLPVAAIVFFVNYLRRLYTYAMSEMEQQVNNTDTLASQ